MKKIIFTSIFLFMLSTLFVSADERFVLVIDPGHGGRDAGAVRGNYKEKDINLGVALALGRLIESNMKDVKVVYTRKTDKFVDLYKRAEIANKAKANLFISIHTNSTASKSTTAQGADTYILGLARSEENLAVAKRENSVILMEDDYNKRYEGFDPNSPESYIIFEFMTDKYMEQSLQFATFVQKGFTNVAKRKDRGVRQAGFLVLRESAMPSVLIELGFINNTTEAKYLSTSIGQRSMASSIFSGLKRYIEDFNKKKGGGVMAAEPNQNATRPVLAENITVEKREPEKIPPANTRTETSSTNEKATYISKDININNLPKTQDPPKTDMKLEPVVEEPVPVVNKTEKKTVVISDTPKDKPAVKEDKNKNNIPAGTIEFRVQFLISQRPLPADSPQFKGLSNVKEYKDDGIYKYTYGSTTNQNEAVRVRNEVRAKFKDAFVVKFRDGVRVK